MSSTLVTITLVMEDAEAPNGTRTQTVFWHHVVRVGDYVTLDGACLRVAKVTWFEADRPHESPEARIVLVPEGGV